MDTLHFDLITPEAVFFSGPASLVEAPGTLGDFGVLPGHMAFISTLRPGIVSVHDANAQVMRIFVAGGIAEVEPGGKSCIVLAEQVTDLAKLSRADAQARLNTARKALDNAFEEDARKDAARNVALAEAIVAALG